MKHFGGYASRQEAEERINGFSGNNHALLKMKKPFFVVYTNDDPVAPGGPRKEWVEVAARSENSAITIFSNGSHLACYEGWRFTRWVDRLLLEWIDAMEAIVSHGEGGCR